MRALLLFLPLFGGIAFVNYKVDPAHLFDWGAYEERLGEHLANNFHVVNVHNFNERWLQRSYVQHLRKKNDIIVIGSSRAQQIGRDTLGKFVDGKRFFNNSVSGSTLGDYLAIYGFYRTAKMLPSTVILGVDPWALNAHAESNRFRSVYESYKSIYDEILKLPGNQALKATSELEEPSRARSLLNAQLEEKLNVAVQIFSPSYLQSSIAFISKYRSLNAKYHTELEFSSSVYPSIKNDGTEWPAASVRTQPVDAVNSIARIYAQMNPMYRLKQFDEPDQELRLLFEGFVQLLHLDGVKVILFLAPYHPLVYERILERRDTAGVAKTESYLHEFATKNSVPIFGSYDPRIAGVGEEYFWDGMHSKPATVPIIFKSLSTH